MAKLTVDPGSINIIGTPVVNFTPPDFAGAPSDAYVLSKAYDNCTSASQTEQFQHSISLQVGQTVTKTRTIVNSVDLTVAVTAKFDFLGDGGSNTNTIHIGQQVTTSNADTQSSQRTLGFVDSPNLTIAAMTQAQLVHTFQQYRVPINFSGTLVVDGELSTNSEGVKRLSEVLIDPKDRTFDFAGIVTDSNIVKTSTVVSEKKLPPASCPANGVFPLDPITMKIDR